MIYLIGGAPRLGKSIIAAQLMRKINTPWLSADVLRSAFYAMTPKDQRDILFPYAGASDNDQVFSAPIKEIVKQQIMEATSMKSGIEALLQHQLDMEDDCILEGVYLLPKYVCAFLKKNQKKSKEIKVLFLVNTDVKSILSGLRANTSPSDWLKGAKPRTYEKVAEFVAEFSQYVKKEAEKYNLPAYERTGHFKKDLAACAGLLAN